MQPGDEFYVSAFYHLNTCRSAGMSEGRIPWNIIYDYGKIQGLDDEILDMFITVIMMMDMKYLKYQHDESEKRSKAKSRRK